jgi:hypothetical protein
MPVSIRRPPGYEPGALAAAPIRIVHISQRDERRLEKDNGNIDIAFPVDTYYLH